MGTKGAILIAGGAGYIGAHCSKAVADAGFTPICYDNLTLGHRSFVQHRRQHQGRQHDPPI